VAVGGVHVDVEADAEAGQPAAHTGTAAGREAVALEVVDGERDGRPARDRIRVGEHLEHGLGGCLDGGGGGPGPHGRRRSQRAARASSAEVTISGSSRRRAGSSARRRRRSRSVTAAASAAGVGGSLAPAWQMPLLREEDGASCCGTTKDGG
jgi:hypothetical protein